MIVDSAVYRGGKRVDIASGADLADMRAKAADGNGFVWVGLHQPDQSELDWVAHGFHLHPLAIEDALKAHQRPKLEHYGDNCLFLVLKTLWYVDENDAVETGEVSLFVGRDYVVTVRHGEGVELHKARLDLEERTTVLGHGPSAVVYAVCDRIVDQYESVVGELEEDVDEVETSVFSPDRTQDSQRIYVLKRELAEARRAVSPLRDPMNQFADAEVELLADKSAPFFRDVADHVVRVSETIESLDGLLSSAFDAHMARISLQQNEDMRKISAWAAIAAVSTLVAGVYGMNFVNMPELKWHYGYYLALILMVGASVLLWRQFKKSGWL